MYHPFVKLTILSLTILIGGCAGTKSFKKKGPIIDKIEVYEDSRLLKNDPVNLIISTSPNKKFFGIPFGKIFYETAHPDPKGQFESWLEKKKNRRKHLEKWISKKQIIALKAYGEKFNDWLKKKGEPPSLLDNNKIINSKKQIIQYYKNLGFYDAEVFSKVLPKNNKKFILKYQIYPKNRYLTDSITASIESAQLEEIYKANQKDQIIKKGDAFEIIKFEEERERLFLLFRNNGIYNFQQNSIQFTAAVGVDAIFIPNSKSAPLNGDVVKTSSGGAYKVPISRVDHLKDVVYFLKAYEVPTIAITEKAEETFYKKDLKGPLAIVFGSEDVGISNGLLKILDDQAKLPMRKSIDSLNVSVACGIIFYEILRQRS